MLTFVLVIASAATDIGEPAFFAGNDELRQYLIEAAQRNPAIKARYLEWQAALEKVPQVTSLEDPMFSYGQYVQATDRNFDASIEQKFPWFGTLRARGDKAMADADAALAKVHAARNEVMAAVKRAYFDYAVLGENIGILEKQAHVLSDFEDVVRQRYSFGLATEQELLQVQIEKDRLEDQRAGLVQSKPAVAARLIEAIGREAVDEIPWPQPADLPPPPPPAPVVLAQIRAANPDLAALQHTIESWDKAGKVARKAGYPDISVMFEYMGMRDLKNNHGKDDSVMAIDSAKMLIQDTPMNGYLPTVGEAAYGFAKDRFLRMSTKVEDDIVVGVKCNIPVWRKRIKAGVKETELMREATEAEKGKATLSLDRAARSVLFDIQDAERRANLYKTSLLPKVNQTYQNLLDAYAAGNDGASFLEMLNTVKMRLEFQLEQARAARDLQNANAELELLMGGPWTGDPAAR